MKLTYNLDFIQDKKQKSQIKKALSILEKSFYTGQRQGGFFLDPYEERVLLSIAEKNDLEIAFFGGNDQAERKAFISGNQGDLSFDDMVEVLSFSHSGRISHPDVLGSLLSLGLTREEIGDIVVFDDHCEFILLKDQAAFVKYNLTKIKNEGVKIDFKGENVLSEVERDFSFSSSFVSSLRLDNLISAFISSSRKEAVKLIKGKDVKVDFEEVDSPSKMVDTGSLISIRHYGRFIFDSVEGRSKKGNYKINYRKFR